jgi:H/ACA ribonucleoprotein complex non-core subunit NAF1
VTPEFLVLGHTALLSVFLSPVMDFQFKVPKSVPQDILLIQEIVGVVPPPKSDVWKHVHKSADSSDDSIASSSSEIDSEDEVEADLMVPEEESSNLTPVL